LLTTLKNVILIADLQIFDLIIFSGEKVNKRTLSVISILLMLVVVVSTPFLLSACSSKSVVKVIDFKLTSEEYAFCVNHVNAYLLEKANDFLIEIKSNGTFNKIVSRYFGKGKPQGVKSAPQNAEDALVVATCADFPPFEYKDGDTYYGVDVEIAAAFAHYLGKRLVIKNVSFEALFYEVQMGHADIAISAISVIETRKNLVDFTNNYYLAGQVIMARSGDGTFDACSTAEDVKKLLATMGEDVTVGYQNGTSAYYFLFGKSHEYTTVYNVTGQGYDTISEAIDAMLNGEINFVMLDEAAAKAIEKQMNGKRK